ncbi:hypothetical protein AAVH_04166 [Aphelenchoides avenae]|nr:hypothetical protein AAVH_04166 [Aphelenchus avenae]
MELVFRNALAQEAASPEALIRIFTVSNRMALDAIVRVTRRFRTALFTTGKVTLCRDKEIASVSLDQFSWMLRWDMLRFETFEISCSRSDQCAKLSEYPYMPTIRELKCSGVDWVKETKGESPLDAYKLASAIISSNKKTLKVLDGLPIGTFKKALPALELDTFSFTPVSAQSISLDPVAKCSMHVFEYDMSRCRSRRTRISLEPLADLHATEIVWKFKDLAGFSTPTISATNSRVVNVSLVAERLRLDMTDVDRLLSFFPKLEILDICANMEITEGYVWDQDENYAKLLEIKLHLAHAHAARRLQVKVHTTYNWKKWKNVKWTPRSFFFEVEKNPNEYVESDGVEQLFNVYETFHRVSKSSTENANKKAADLGLRRVDANGTTIFKRRMDFVDVFVNVELTVL